MKVTEEQAESQLSALFQWNSEDQSAPVQCRFHRTAMEGKPLDTPVADFGVEEKAEYRLKEEMR